MTGWVVFFVCVATAVSVAAWLAGYAVGVADGTRLLIEWCRRHMDTDWGAAMTAGVVQGFLAMEPPTVTHNDLVVRRGRGGRSFVGKSDRLREAEDAICARMRRIAPEEPVRGPVRVSVRLCFPTRGRHAQGAPMDDVPDLDNSFKTLGDCMVRCGLVEDDRLIVQLSLAKAWSDPAGIWVRVEPL